MEASNLSLKKLMKYILVVVVVIFIVMYAYSYLSNGTLRVNSTSGATIIVASYDKPNPIKIGKGKASAHLKPGQYLVEASSGGSATRMPVTIKRLHTSIADLDIEQAKPAAVVASDDVAKKIKVNSDGSITFLASSFRQLFSYSSGRNTPYLPDFYPVIQADWLANNGLVISDGTNYTSYIDPSGKINNVGDNLSQKESNYSVSLSGQVAYIDSSKLMFRPSPVSPAINLAAQIENGSYNIQISPDGKMVLVYSDFRGADSKTASGFKNYIVNVSSPSSPEIFSTKAAIDSAAWSTNSNKLAYSVGSNLTEYNLNTRAHNALATIKPTPVWVLGYDSSDNLLYAQDSAIWKANMQKLLAVKLSLYSGSIEPASLYVSGDTIYYSTSADKAGAGGNIYKISM